MSLIETMAFGGTHAGKLQHRSLDPGALNRMMIPRRMRTIENDSVLKSIPSISRFLANMVNVMKKGYGIFVHTTGRSVAAELCVILCEARKRGYTGLYLDAVNALEASMRPTPFDDSCTLIQRAKGVNLLVLDGLGTETEIAENKIVAGHMTRLINERVNNLGSTLISSNVSVEEATKIYGDRFRPMLEGFFVCETVNPEEIQS